MCIRDRRNSIPRHMRAWRKPNARFIVLHDQDSQDCAKLKTELRRLCEQGGKPGASVCIVCRELEAWYWGDLDAVAKAFPGFKPNQVKDRAQYRNPDGIQKPARVLGKYIPEFHKGLASQAIPKHMDIHGNRSPSFQYFLKRGAALEAERDA